MPALPTRTTMSNPYPAPTDAAGRAWLLGLWDSFAGLLGSAATPASARDGLLLPRRAAKNLLVNQNFSINQRGSGITGFANGNYVRDMWTLFAGTGDADTFTAKTSSTGQLLTHSGSGFLKQSVGALKPGDYVLSTTGTAKIYVYIASAADPLPPSDSYSFLSGPIPFTVPVIAGGYSVNIYIANGTLGTVLLEEGAFATEAEQRSDLEELRLCQQTCFAYSGGLGSARSSDNLFESMLHLPVAFGSNIAIESATFTPSTGSAGTPQIYVGVGSPASKQSAFIRNSANNWTVGAQIQLNAVFVPS